MSVSWRLFAFDVFKSGSAKAARWLAEEMFCSVTTKHGSVLRHLWSEKWHWDFMSPWTKYTIVFPPLINNNITTHTTLNNKTLIKMAASALDLTRNFVSIPPCHRGTTNITDILYFQSLYTIPAAWVLSIAPHFYAASLGKFDNKSPRAYTKESSSDQSIDKATKERIIRAEGAQQNGFENIGLFAAAVVAGNIARLDNWTLNALTGGYLLSRVAYNLLYINNTTDALGECILKLLAMLYEC